ncbi:hypothetical protein BDD12DRAFT_853823 [Trichophaea hybrida]|nr:hypothetical protein BDD12DRAFT_853823 [Trichophaea hybrida]
MSTFSQSKTSRPKPLIPEFSSPTFSPTGRFNPKSVTEAAIAARNAPPKPKPSGPLLHLDFRNNTNDFKRPALRKCPVSKIAITWTRYISLVLRLGQLLGAMGILVTMLLMRNVDNFTGWICRIPPAVATVHTFYAIYHLSGSYRLKTPASSKVYFLFSSSIDVAIITCYAFTGIASWRQHVQGGNMAWTTVFNDIDINSKIVLTVFLLVCISGGLTVITLTLGLYLVHALRKLSNLPPDANPFVEDEDPQLSVKEKRWSSSTTDSETPFLETEKRAIPFAATRQKVDGAYTPPRGGKYTYQTLSLNSIDLDVGESRRDSRREEKLGAGYGQVEETPRTPTLKRGSRVARPASVCSTPSNDTPRSTKRSSIVVSEYTLAQEDVHVPIPESQRNSVVSQKSWGTGGAVQGYSKASLLAQGNDGKEARFRKVSGEAN